MPTAEQIKQFVVGVILPPVVGALVSFIASTEVLNVFNISHDQLAAWVSAVLVFGVVTVIGWLKVHGILKGIYTPAAKAAARRSSV